MAASLSAPSDFRMVLWKFPANGPTWEPATMECSMIGSAGRRRSRAPRPKCSPRPQSPSGSGIITGYAPRDRTSDFGSMACSPPTMRRKTPVSPPQASLAFKPMAARCPLFATRTSPSRNCPQRKGSSTSNASATGRPSAPAKPQQRNGAAPAPPPYFPGSRVCRRRHVRQDASRFVSALSCPVLLLARPVIRPVWTIYWKTANDLLAGHRAVRLSPPPR